MNQVSLSLANKYRPQTFDQMIGQQHIIGILKAKMQSSRDSLQNYLLCGPRGTGKTTSARILAKAINCLNPQDGNPCNQCANCMTIQNNATLDYVEIDAASHTGVDNIREEILSKALYPPTQLKKKIYVIDEVHMLSKGAFNSLLKTIEEPKGNVCFILATTEIHKVPDTIVSRCQVFQFKKVTETEIADHLEEICKKEGFKYDKSALELIANISDGGVRDSVKYLDQVSILGNISSEHVSKFLGISSESSIKDFLELIKTGKRENIFQRIEEVNESWIDLHQFAKQTLGFIDKHLLEDTDFYLQISQVFGDIIRQIRFYPYPSVLYKISINNYLLPEEKITKPIMNSSRKEEKQSEVEQESKVENTQGKETKKDNDEIIKQPDTEISGDFSQLRTNILSKISKPTIQSNLKDHVIIENIEEGNANLIVTNKIAEMLLQNTETKKEIETIFSQEQGKETTISFKFESKEEYFSRTLWL